MVLTQSNTIDKQHFQAVRQRSKQNGVFKAATRMNSMLATLLLLYRLFGFIHSHTK